jgi:predicted RNase H-like nuclease (RuvC/YqgF family)
MIMKKLNQIPIKIFTVLLVLVFFASCQKYKREIVSLNSSKDSIQQVANARNDKVLQYVASFNEIQGNLDSIKRVQKILSINLSDPNKEVKQSEKDKIIEDINHINNLLTENKKLVASLQAKLKKSNLRVSELEKMVENFKAQIEEKDAEIIALNTQLEKMKIDISQLNEKVTVLSDESQKKSETIEQQKNELNVAWYCFGSKEELVKNNVVEKIGGFVGLGKSVKMKSSFNHDYFKKVDIRNFSEITLMVKKAILITTHPDGSFHFTGTEKKVENLVIDKPDEFWKASKYLVIQVEP